MPKKKVSKSASRRVTKSVKKSTQRRSSALSPYSFSQAFFVIAGIMLILTGAIFIAHDKQSNHHEDLTAPTPVEQLPTATPTIYP